MGTKYQKMGRKKKGVKEPARVPPGQDRLTTLIPAPDGLEAIQAFLNTSPTWDEEDALRTPRDLANLLARHGLLADGTELDADDLERARRIRHGLRTLLLAHTGGEIDAEAIADLDRAAAGAQPRLRFDADGGSRLATAGRDFDEALGTLLGRVHEARCSGQWRSLKLCANDRCRKTFFDFTKSHTGRWCTRRCGERVRARDYRRSPKYRRPGRSVRLSPKPRTRR